MAFMPYVEFLIDFGVRYAKRARDSGMKNKGATKQQTKQQYVDLYSGSDYLMYSRYSSIMVQVLMSFMYGMFMPVFFFTTLIGLFNMYIVDRLALAYYHKKPPHYDTELNDKAIYTLKRAPIIMFMFGYWALSNRQIFFNETGEITNTNKSQDPDHGLLYFGEGLDHTHLILIVLLYFLILSLMDFDSANALTYKCQRNIFKKCCKCNKLKELRHRDVNEGLNYYWESITGPQQKLWYTSECYQRKALGIKTIDNTACEHLRTAQRQQHYF